MFRSLRGRLIVLLLLVVAAAIATGVLMVGLFRQSATARAGQAESEIGRACDAITAAYQFYSAGWQGPARGRYDDTLRRDLTAVVQTALRDRAGIEGGIWQAEAGSLAYAFPTYQGSGPKTDLPQAELGRIQAVNRAALLFRKLARGFRQLARQCFFREMQDAFGFIARLDQLALGKILLGEFDRFLEHAFDFGIVETVGWLDFNRVLRAGAQIARGNLQDAARVDQKFHFNPR